MFAAPAFAASANKAKASAAPAAAPEEKEEEEETEGANKATAELPADPSGKLYENFEIKRGFYVASDIGLVWAFGGAEGGVSNTQAYVGLNIGYDFTSWFGWQLHGGRGFAASSPRSVNQLERIRDFGWTNVLTGPVFFIKVWERLGLEVKLHGGIAVLDPVPLEVNVDGIQLSTVAPTVGGGIALKYATLLTNFMLGLEITFNYMLLVNVPALNVSPLVARYTF
jgi:hypothetical protein